MTIDEHVCGTCKWKKESSCYLNPPVSTQLKNSKGAYSEHWQRPYVLFHSLACSHYVEWEVLDAKKR